MKSFIIFAAALLLPVLVSGNPLSLTPLYESCGLRFKSAERGAVRLEYRLNGGEWKEGLRPEYCHARGEYRGGAVFLREDSEYEFRLSDTQGTELARERCRTWSSTVPVAREIELDAETLKTPLRITEQGRPDAWIRYRAKPGTVIGSDSKAEAVISLDKAAYVILEGLEIRGGRHGVTVNSSNHIRIINCDISGWGRIGTQRFDKDGKYYEGDERRAINYDAAVNINYSSNVTVERCYAHDPRGSANPWAFSHPTGPNAVAIRSKGGTVIRYNDFIGSDCHRWNDCIEGIANEKEDGGFHHDADIYGNMLALGNDDGVELDGGQMNIRTWYNKIEGFLCGISTAPCFLGPSYIFRNLIVNLGDELNCANLAFKNIYSECGTGRIYFFNNTVYADAVGFSKYGDKGELPKELVKGFSRNNLMYCSGELISPGMFKRRSDFDHDLLFSDNPELPLDLKALAAHGAEKHGVIGKNPRLKNIPAGDFSLKPDSPAIDAGTVVPGFVETFSGKAPDIGAFEHGGGLDLPYRPIPVHTARAQLNFDGVGNVIELPVRVGGSDFSGNYSIRINQASDWLSVEPAQGVLSSGMESTLKVKVDYSRLPVAGINRAVFLIRMADGYSRPVSVYARNPSPLRQVEISGPHVYINASRPDGKALMTGSPDPETFGGSVYFEGWNENKYQEYSFDLPEPGVYYILLRVKSPTPVGLHDSIFMEVNGGGMKQVSLYSAVTWVWALASINPRNRLQPHRLEAGQNTIRLAPRESIHVDQILVAKEPWPVFGRPRKKTGK